jgi:GNAT superfamily N-acetyltransferase
VTSEPSRSPAEAARRAAAADRADLDRLTADARAATAAARGGRLLALFDEPQARLDELLTAATEGASGSAAWIGTLDAHAVGYAVAGIEPLPDGSSLAVLHEIYVEAGGRELGVGEALLDAAIAWAVEQGCGGIDARALPGDRATKNFFESAGMVARSIVVHRDLPAPPATPAP